MKILLDKWILFLISSSSLSYFNETFVIFVALRKNIFRLIKHRHIQQSISFYIAFMRRDLTEHLWGRSEIFLHDYAELAEMILYDD